MERDHLQPEDVVPRQQSVDEAERPAESLEAEPAGLDRNEPTEDVAPAEPEESVRHEGFEENDAA